VIGTVVADIRGEEYVCYDKLTQVYWAVKDTRTNAVDHLVNAEIIKVVSRDDLESDDLFVLCQISFTLRVTVTQATVHSEHVCAVDSHSQVGDAQSSCTGCLHAHSCLTRALLRARYGRTCRA
jgi:hypothetical protein